MAFGIISIITYLLFLMWAQISAPKGEKQIPESGSFYNLASALLMAFSVHDFIVQNIIKNPHR
jgi:hydrogenase-4 membrane subunit HyfE